jgi:hypothetical protein
VWLAVACTGLALDFGCSGSRARPTAPPPEYEKPTVSAWDAGAPPPDEFSEAERGGEPVTDTDEESSGDAGKDALPPAD